MSETGSKTAWAAYLVGHGPLRKPRPIELQLMRILRYQSLLGSRDEFQGFWRESSIYVDLNYPRSKLFYRRENFPQFQQMLEDLEGRSIGLVLIDVQESVGIYDSYSWIRDALVNAGVRVVNVFYDSENLIKEYIEERYRGHAHVQEVDDGSDFVNFFPTLSAAIGRAALDPGFRLGHRRRERFEAATSRLHLIGEQNPYSGGREPFIQEDLTDEWFRRLDEVRANERVERRHHEQLFRIAPRMPGLLIEEDIGISAQVRNSEELAKAEERVKQLGLEKIVEDRFISYVFHGNGFDVYADIRSKAKLLFYIYRLPEQAKSSDKSNAYFALPDRFTRDVEGKWRAALGEAMSRYTGT
jgi:hypothetical protein